MSAPSAGRYVLHGLKLSYFTGKLEAYLRVKGVPFDYVEMDTADFRACARATGVAQMPQVQAPDGTWLTDTTAIIARFETELPTPALTPSTPRGAFVARLLEDAFDEWLWRPALYFRWAFKEDARLMGRQIARTLLRDVPGPLWLRAWVIRRRQQRVFLKEDGVTSQTRAAIEQSFVDVTTQLDTALSQRPYLFGDRPCIADFGLMGPVFRHFSYDPTPAAILRESAPHLLAWQARLWAAGPTDLAATPAPEDAPADLDPLLRMIGDDYLPYLAANAAALARGEREVRYTAADVDWRVPVFPYRSHCLAALQAGFASLTAADRAQVAERVGPAGAAVLAETAPAPRPPTPGHKTLDRRWA